MSKAVQWVPMGQRRHGDDVGEVIEQIGFGRIGTWISHTGEAIEQRDQICRAVSCFDDLLAACNAIADDVIPEFLKDHPGSYQSIGLLRRALARAKGEA